MEQPNYLHLKMERLLIILLLVQASCVAPEQPKLNEKEEKFIAGMEKKYAGRTNRYIDVKLLIDTSNHHEKGGYSLVMEVNCETLYQLGKDSTKLMKDAFFIAKRLYNEVLEKSARYNEIMVAFTCDTSSSKFQNLIFEYKVDSLFK